MRLFDCVSPVAVGFAGNIEIDFTAVALSLGSGVKIVSCPVILITQSPGLSISDSTILSSGLGVLAHVVATLPGTFKITASPTYTDQAATVDPRTILISVLPTLG